jgi:hypothetical protein
VYEIFTDIRVNLFDPTDKGLVDKVSKGIHAPYVNVSISTLGGVDRASLLIKLSLDPKEKWGNGILQNSRYAMFRVDRPGTVELFSGGGKFRNANVKTLDDAINKINDYIKSR